MKTLKNDWKLGAAVGTALSLGSAGAIAGPHGFDLHNVLNGASASIAGTSIAHVEDPVSAVFGNPATLTTYYGGTNFMFGATFYMPRATMVHDGSAGHAVSGLVISNRLLILMNPCTSLLLYKQQWCGSTANAFTFATFYIKS